MDVTPLINEQFRCFLHYSWPQLAIKPWKWPVPHGCFCMHGATPQFTSHRPEISVAVAESHSVQPISSFASSSARLSRRICPNHMQLNVQKKQQSTPEVVQCKWVFDWKIGSPSRAFIVSTALVDRPEHPTMKVGRWKICHDISTKSRCLQRVQLPASKGFGLGPMEHQVFDSTVKCIYPRECWSKIPARQSWYPLGKESTLYGSAFVVVLYIYVTFNINLLIRRNYCKQQHGRARCLDDSTFHSACLWALFYEWLQLKITSFAVDFSLPTEKPSQGKFKSLENSWNIYA